MKTRLGHALATVGAWLMSVGLRVSGWNHVRLTWEGYRREGQVGERIETHDVCYVVERWEGDNRELGLVAYTLQDAVLYLQFYRDTHEPGIDGAFWITECLDGRPGRTVSIDDTEEWSGDGPLFPLEASAE